MFPDESAASVRHLPAPAGAAEPAGGLGGRGVAPIALTRRCAGALSARSGSLWRQGGHCGPPLGLPFALLSLVLAGCGGTSHVRLSKEKPELYSIRSDGSHLHAVHVVGTGLSRGPGKEVALIHGGRLGVMDDNGDQLRLLGRAEFGSEDPIAPAWSPDGSRIAVGDGRNCDPYGPCQRWDTSIVDPAARRRRATIRYARQPSWSSDGRMLAYTGGSGNGDPKAQVAFGVFTAQADGSDRRLLARGAYPAWSPNGKQIAFFALRRGGGFLGVYVMRPNGKARRLVAFGENIFSWAPDGERLAFIVPFGRPRSLEVVSVRTGQTKRIGPASFMKPGAIAWSPDGERLVWVAYDFRSNEDRLLVAPSTGTQKPRQLVRLPPRFHIWTPIFSHDGSRVLYVVSYIH